MSCMKAVCQDYLVLCKYTYFLSFSKLSAMYPSLFCENIKYKYYHLLNSQQCIYPPLLTPNMVTAHILYYLPMQGAPTILFPITFKIKI